MLGIGLPTGERLLDADSVGDASLHIPVGAQGLHGELLVSQFGEEVVDFGKRGAMGVDEFSERCHGSRT